MYQSSKPCNTPAIFGCCPHYELFAQSQCLTSKIALCREGQIRTEWRYAIIWVETKTALFLSWMIAFLYEIVGKKWKTCSLKLTVDCSKELLQKEGEEDGGGGKWAFEANFTLWKNERQWVAHPKYEGFIPLSPTPIKFPPVRPIQGCSTTNYNDHSTDESYWKTMTEILKGTPWHLPSPYWEIPAHKEKKGVLLNCTLLLGQRPYVSVKVWVFPL